MRWWKGFLTRTASTASCCAGSRSWESARGAPLRGARDRRGRTASADGHPPRGGSGTRAILEQELSGYNESLQRFQRHICISSFKLILNLVEADNGRTLREQRHPGRDARISAAAPTSRRESARPPAQGRGPPKSADGFDEQVLPAPAAPPAIIPGLHAAT